LLIVLKCDEVSVTSAVRLGKKLSTDGNALNTRPLKIVLASVAQRDKILSNAKNLKDNKEMSRVFILPDLTPNQRMRRQSLVNELKSRKAAGEEDLIIVNNRIVTRRARQDKPAPA